MASSLNLVEQNHGGADDPASKQEQDNGFKGALDKIDRRGVAAEKTVGNIEQLVDPQGKNHDTEAEIFVNQDSSEEFTTGHGCFYL